MKEVCVALLGRRDEPTDGVQEYCQFLGRALDMRGISLELKRIPWYEIGWRRALGGLEIQASNWRNQWILIQYAALAWSRRGISRKLVELVRLLRKNGVRCGVVFHDAQPYGGDRLVDKIRRRLQTSTMKELARLSDLTALTVPREKTKWLPTHIENVVFIPVGANLPSPETGWRRIRKRTEALPTVVAFSLSHGVVGADEVKSIVEGVSYVTKRIGRLQLVILGRNAEPAEGLLRQSLGGIDVELNLRGILPGEEVVTLLGQCDVMLFARGPISSRRGSAIAGIACGLPVVAAEGWETAAPITEAGVVLTKPGESFGPALLHILSDPDYRESLAEQSRKAQESYFSWSSIAQRYCTAIQRRYLRTNAESC